jgi:bifunctional non-homologous end joining protein LigD
MPHHIKPMLAILGDEPFDDDNWFFEIKLDGWRAIAEVDQNNFELYSRNFLSFNERFPDVIKGLKKLNLKTAIFDGELVVLDSKGKSQFQLLQNYQQEQNNIYYYIFDLLYLDGQDLRDRPLHERKEILEELLMKKNRSECIRYCNHVQGKGKLFYKKAAEMNLEGIIAKNALSLYQSSRTRNWLKIKTHLRQEMVIAGFTKPKGSRSHFGSLLVGYYHKDEFIFAGNVGGGFSEKNLQSTFKELNNLVQENCPFKIPPKGIKKPTWVQPKMVCEVEFSEWTKDGKLRHPVFKGLRIDKPPKEVIKEVPDDR